MIFLALQTLKGDQRTSYMNKFTKGVADQLPPKAKTRYMQLTKKLQSITNEIPGGLPKQRQEVRRGTEAGTGKTVIEYDDGTVEYAE